MKCGLIQFIQSANIFFYYSACTVLEVERRAVQKTNENRVTIPVLQASERNKSLMDKIGSYLTQSHMVKSKPCGFLGQEHSVHSTVKSVKLVGPGGQRGWKTGWR